MDVFTLCFAYPSCHVRVLDGGYKPVFHPSTSNADVDGDLSGAGNGIGNGNEDDGITTYERHADAQFQRLYPSDASLDEEFDNVHQKCLAISAATGCLVSAVRRDSDSGDDTRDGSARIDAGKGDGMRNGEGDGKPRGWEFQLSGGYAQVMDARRRIMAEFRPDVSDFASRKFMYGVSRFSRLLTLSVYLARQVKASIKVPAIHILQSIHSAAPFSTPLHHSQHDLSPPSTSSSTPPIKPDVRARLHGIEERTGAKIHVRSLKQENAAFGEGSFGFGNLNSVQAPQPSVKLPWTIQQPSSSPPQSSPTTTHPGVPISDSARSKSMYPFLPAHQMPQVLEQHEEKGDEIQRTDSPECIASPESISIPLPTDGLQSAGPHPGHIVDTPNHEPPSNPWSARSKTMDAPRPRVAGLKTPLSAAPPSAVPSLAPGVTDEEAMLEELRVWGFEHP